MHNYKPIGYKRDNIIALPTKSLTPLSKIDGRRACIFVSSITVISAPPHTHTHEKHFRRRTRLIFTENNVVV